MKHDAKIIEYSNGLVFKLKNRRVSVIAYPDKQIVNIRELRAENNLKIDRTIKKNAISTILTLQPEVAEMILIGLANNCNYKLTKK